MLTLGILGSLASGAGKIFQGAQQKRAARQNYQNQQTALQDQYKAGKDQIGMFADQGQQYLSSMNAGYGASGLKSAGTENLMRGSSQSALNQDVQRMKEQNQLNYSRGVDQAWNDMEAGVAAGNGMFLDAAGGLLNSASSIYSQGVNQGRWTPGADKSGRWRMNIPQNKNTNRFLDPYQKKKN